MIIDQIAQLEHQLFPEDAWTSASITELLQSAPNQVLSLEKNGQLLGYCLYQVSFEIAEILRIGVQPALQYQGLGKQLINQLIERLTMQGVENLLLEVRADNLSAIRFYQKHGFTHLHTRKNYYALKNGGRIDAWVMQRLLSASPTAGQPSKSSNNDA